MTTAVLDIWVCPICQTKSAQLEIEYLRDQDGISHQFSVGCQCGARFTPRPPDVRELALMYTQWNRGD